MKIFVNGEEIKDSSVCIVFEDLLDEEAGRVDLHIHPTDEGLVYDVYKGDTIIKSSYEFSSDIADNCVYP